MDLEKELNYIHEHFKNITPNQLFKNLVECGVRVTPDNITELKDNEIFVFGSNLAGRHGRGAAKTALKWGAIYGEGIGLFGQTYAIPTVNYYVTNKLSLSDISIYVKDFVNTAREEKDKIFLVTEIGCGLAGGTVEDIAPLFRECIDIGNIYLPRRFWDILLKELI